MLPRWFHESHKGDMRVRIGQDFTAMGEPEVVILFERRVNWKWVAIGQFRYLEVPNLRHLLVQVDQYMRILLTHQ